MNHERVSICIPCYNKREYVKRCLESISIQTYKNIEVILSDDSNNKEIELLVREFPQLNIAYHHNIQPLKSPRNWNHALDLATGDFLMLLHQDDWLKRPDSIERFLNSFEDDVDFVFCMNIGFDEKGNKIDFQISEKIPDLNAFPEYLVIRCVIGPPSNVIFRRRVDKRYDEDLIWLVDVDYYISLIKAGYKFMYIKEHLVNIGIHPDQTTEYVRENRSIAFKENLFVANKIGTMPFKKINLFDYYWRLLRNFRIRTWQELSSYNILSNKLEPVFRYMVNTQSILPYKFLRYGFISKTLMFLTYIKWRLANG